MGSSFSAYGDGSVLRRRAVFWSLVVGLLAMNLAVSAAEPEQQHDGATASTGLIEAYLVAGEFSPAMRLAEQLEDPYSRDKALAIIAHSQQQTGVRGGVSRTLRSISDDVLRGGAVDQILAARFDGQPFLAQFDEGDGDGSINSTANFDAVIDLIQTTIEPDTWEDGGGTGRIGEFETGVRVDAEGELRRVMAVTHSSPLVRLRQASFRMGANRDIRSVSTLRKISLPRLERQIQLRLAEGQRPTQEMKVLAGLERIQYVFVYPETGDLVVAGPAGDWRDGHESGPISVTSGRPVLQLDDLVVMLRLMRGTDPILFGCSITPTQEGLAKTRALAERSRNVQLRKGEAAREEWVDTIRQAMGRQSIDIYGVDPRTRVARVIVEADYHMKLVGMGLEDGAGDVVSYLDSIELKEGQAPPSLGVLRWWFSLNYKALRATNEGNGFQIAGQGVQVRSENEQLSKAGERIHTGKSDRLTGGFARSFTSNFPRLAEKYPMYADMQNIFDLALVAALFKERQLPESVDWQLTCFDNPQQYQVALGTAPKSVDSVINYRAFPTGQIVAGVSGGVRVDPAELVKADAVRVAKGSELARQREYSEPPESIDRWWWD